MQANAFSVDGVDWRPPALLICVVFWSAEGTCGWSPSSLEHPVLVLCHCSNPAFMLCSALPAAGWNDVLLFVTCSQHIYTVCVTRASTRTRHWHADDRVPLFPNVCDKYMRYLLWVRRSLEPGHDKGVIDRYSLQMKGSCWCMYQPWVDKRCWRPPSVLMVTSGWHWFLLSTVFQGLLFPSLNMCTMYVWTYVCTTWSLLTMCADHCCCTMWHNFVETL